MTKQTENNGGVGGHNSLATSNHNSNGGISTTTTSSGMSTVAVTSASVSATTGGTNPGTTTSCFPAVNSRDLCPNFEADDIIGDGESGSGGGPFTHKSYNSAQDTIYLCNFRVSVDGDWLCLRQLDDVEVPMQRPPSYYETLPPSPEFVPFYGSNNIFLKLFIQYLLNRHTTRSIHNS